MCNVQLLDYIVEDLTVHAVIALEKVQLNVDSANQENPDCVVFYFENNFTACQSHITACQANI